MHHFELVNRLGNFRRGSLGGVEYATSALSRGLLLELHVGWLGLEHARLLGEDGWLLLELHVEWLGLERARLLGEDDWLLVELHVEHGPRGPPCKARLPECMVGSCTCPNPARESP